MSSETGSNASFAFVASFDEQRNNFAFYLGGVMAANFFLILFVSFIHRRKLAAVVVLSKPGEQWMVYEYLVVLKTSLKLCASLSHHGRVSVQLLGNFQNSQWFHLRQEAVAQNILKRGHTDTFVVHTAVDLGELQCVSIKLSSWPTGWKVTWKPCFVEVIRCSNLERWGAKISRVMKCKTSETWTYDLLRNKRERMSFMKLLMINHSWLALFNNPHRLGAFTSITSVVVFFFTNAVLLITTLSAYIFAHMLTEDTMAMYNRSEDDVILCSVCSAVVLGFVQVLELVLRNIRPSRVRPNQPAWNGLWHPQFPVNPEFLDITYEWDRRVNVVSYVDQRTASMSSLISTDSSLSSSSSECLSDGTVPINVPEVPEQRTFFRFLYADSTTKKIQDHVKIAMDQIAGREVSGAVSLRNRFPNRRGKPLPRFDWNCPLDIIEVEPIGQESSRKECFFCLWIKTLPVRGTTLQHYSMRLVRNVRRSFRALAASETPNLTSLLLVMCIHQWLASLSCRLLREVVRRLDNRTPQVLAYLYKRLLNEESILWFAELGFADVRPVASMDALQSKRNVKESYETERLTNLCSNFYIAILRYLAFVSYTKDHDIFFRNRAKRDDSDSSGSDDYNDSHIVSRRRMNKRRTKQRGSGPDRGREHEKKEDLGNTVQEGKSLNGSSGDDVDFVKNAPLSWSSGSCLSLQSSEYDFQCLVHVQDVEQEASPVASSSHLDVFEVDVLQFDDEVFQPTCENGDKIKQARDRFPTNTNKHFEFFMDQDIDDATRQHTEAKHLLTNSDDSFPCVRKKAVPGKMDRLVRFKTDDSNPRREVLPWQQREHVPSNIDPNGRKLNSQETDSRGRERVSAKRSREYGCVGLRDQFSVQVETYVPSAKKKREQEETMFKPVATCKTDRIPFRKKEEWPTEKTVFSDLELSITAHGGERKRLANVSNIENWTKLGLPQRGMNISMEMFPRQTSLGRSTSNLEESDASDNSDSDSLNTFMVDLTERDRSNSSLYSAKTRRTIRQGGSGKKYLAGRRYRGSEKKRKYSLPQTFSSQSVSKQRRFHDRVKSMGRKDSRTVRFMQGSRVDARSTFRTLRLSAAFDAKWNLPLKNVWQDTRIFHKQSQSTIPRANLTLVHSLCSSFYNCSNECYFTVDSAMGISCTCCDYPLCQTYAVVFSLFGKYASSILTRLLPKVNSQLVSMQSAHQTYHLALRPSHSPSALRKHHAAWKAMEKSLEKKMGKKVFESSLKMRLFLKRNKNKSANANCCSSQSSSTTSSSSSESKASSKKMNVSLKSNENKFAKANCCSRQSSSTSSSSSESKASYVSTMWSSASIDPEVLDNEVILMVEAVIEEAKEELFEEVCYLLVTKTILAQVVGEARVEISRELNDPIQVAVRKFSHAKIVSLLRALLPHNYEEDEIVTPDEIRRRRRQRRRRSERHYDLRAPPRIPWGYEVVEDVLEMLTSRWMLNLEYNTHAFTLTFLARSLTLANLHMHGDWRELQLRPLQFRLPRMSVFDSMSHVLAVQHRVAEAIDEAASEVLRHIPPIALTVQQNVSESFYDREKLVIYVCEKVSILEQAALDHLAVAVIQRASEAVQDELIRLALEKQRIERSTQTLKRKRNVRFKTSDYSIDTKQMRSIRLGQAMYTVHARLP
ncbi:uncharacterized protein LOC112556411 isoform X2 [Pomacea canaliculata]|uniref:uncharacterized protein LOC112556411 isoform X2 n=1 Tax=Pomacea canaliculata TaxID=400727 RepID=UPI000D733EFD|nr:uncharacterized protein LOC112556411 isoform X2 [Pomacea canaliculata]